MSWMVLITQVALPLSLLLWLALLPAPGWLLWSLQLVSVALALLGLALTALWTLPPFWTPWLYGAVLVAIAVTQLAQGLPGTPVSAPTPAGTLVSLAVAGGLGIMGAYLAWHSWQGRSLPEGEVVDIAPPFGPGHYLVAHGGSTPMVNVHLKTLDRSVPRFKPWRGQSKALDIFRTSASGLHKAGWQPADPARYHTFGTPVVAPCQGQIALVIDGLKDMPVPVMDRKHMAGNHIAIQCDDYYIILAHLRQGSITVSEGEQVQPGDALGQMGNSGNSSEPHLHVHAQKSLPNDNPLGGEPLWLTINHRFLVRNSRLHVTGNKAVKAP